MKSVSIALYVLLMGGFLIGDDGVSSPLADTRHEFGTLLVEVFETRLASAQNDLAIDERILARRKEHAEVLRKLVPKAVIPHTEYKDAVLASDKAALDVQASKIAVREAEALLKLVKFGHKNDLLEPRDLGDYLQERIRRGR